MESVVHVAVKTMFKYFQTQRYLLLSLTSTAVQKKGKLYPDKTVIFCIEIRDIVINHGNFSVVLIVTEKDLKTKHISLFYCENC